jgi:recombination protein RecT
MLGLEPIPQLGYCYFIPFKNKHNRDEKGEVQKEVQFMIGYKGQIQLANRSSEVTSIYAQVVFENDHFEYEFGLEPVLKHKPALGDRGKPVYVYAATKYKNGGYNFEVMSEYDVEKIRRRAQSQQLWDTKNKRLYPSPEPIGVWKTDTEAMWKKTAIKQVLKYAPMSIEYQKAMMTDGAILKAEDFQEGEVDLAAVENADAQVEDNDSNVPDNVDPSTGEVTEPSNPQNESDNGQLFQGEDTTNYESPASVIEKIKSFDNLEALDKWKKEKIRFLQSFGGKDGDIVTETLDAKEKELLSKTNKRKN